MDWRSSVSHCGSGVYSDKIGTVFQALCPHEPARAHKQHMHVCVCVKYMNVRVCSCSLLLRAHYSGGDIIH